MVQKSLSSSHGAGSWMLVICGTAVASLSAFSPIVASMFLLCLYSLVGGKARFARIIISIGFAIVISIIYSSRQTFSSPFDDFSNVYYQWYIQLKDSGLAAFFRERFSGEVHISEFEIGTPILLGIIAELPWTLSIGSVIFLVTLIGGGMYIYWIEKYFLPEIEPAKRNCACVLAIGLFGFGLCSQTLRQMWSIPILLCALWEPRWKRRIFFVLLAGVFHESSLVIALLGWVVAASKRLSTILIVLVLIAGATYSSRLTGLLVGSDAEVLDKARYYTQIQHDAVPIDLKYLPVIAAVAVISLFAWRFRNGWLSKLIILSLILYVILLPLPLASYRTTLFLTTALIGPVVALALAPRIKPRLMMFLGLVLALAMLGRRAYIVGEGTGMGLWYKFPAASKVPFYYTSVLFSNDTRD